MLCYVIFNAMISERSGKDEHRAHIRILCEEYPCKVIRWCMQFLRSYHIHTAAAWSWASLKEGHTTVELIQYFDVDNISVKLQNDTGNFEGVRIMFTS